MKRAIKLVTTGKTVHIYADDSEGGSCGDHVMDWRYVGYVDMIDLLKSVESLATGKTERQYL